MKRITGISITFCLFFLYFFSCEKDISSLKILKNSKPYFAPEIVSLEVGNWYLFHAYAGNDQYVVDYFFSRKIIGDTLINLYQYFIIGNEDMSKDYLRIQDSLILFNENAKDQVLFDFNLSNGDTFIYESKSLIVDSIEYVSVSVPSEKQRIIHSSNRKIVSSGSCIISLGYATKFGLLYYWESLPDNFQGYRLTEALIDSIEYDL